MWKCASGVQSHPGQPDRLAQHAPFRSLLKEVTDRSDTLLNAFFKSRGVRAANEAASYELRPLGEEAGPPSGWWAQDFGFGTA